MATCGKCKAVNVQVDHVKACYQTGGVAVMEAPQVAVKHHVPDSHYVLLNPAGDPVFYEVKAGKKKWDGYTFVNRLIGAPGDYRQVRISKIEREAVLARLAEDPKAAAIAYSFHFGVCACCQAPLTDPESLERGLGPVCAKRF